MMYSNSSATHVTSSFTSISVSQQVSIDVMDVGVDGGTAGDTAGGHVGVSFRVDVLQALPWHAWAKLYNNKTVVMSKKLHEKLHFLIELNFCNACKDQTLRKNLTEIVKLDGIIAPSPSSE